MIKETFSSVKNLFSLGSMINSSILAALALMLASVGSGLYHKFYTWEQWQKLYLSPTGKGSTFGNVFEMLKAFLNSPEALVQGAYCFLVIVCFLLFVKGAIAHKGGSGKGEKKTKPE